MPKYFQIKVPAPCEQQWEQMQPTASGNFCGTCKKTVIDFTGFTDNQLMEYFKNHASGVCGRFYTDQLEQSLRIPAKKIPWLIYFFRVAIPAMLLNFKAQGQKLINKNGEPFMTVENKIPKLPFNTAVTVTGRIIGDAGQPVPGASVMITGSSKGIAADSNGIFSISLDKKERSLEISSVGYENKQVTVTGINTTIQLSVPLKDNVVIQSATSTRCGRTFTAGGAYGIVSRTIRQIDTVPRSSISENAFIVFPNPVQANGFLTIRWQTTSLNKQRLIIYNAAGSKLMEKTIAIKQNIQPEQVRLNNYPAGFYILSVMDCKTKKIQTATFIIQ
ncbi:MAG: carboxypeptidase-like regulatory domain-containing protein [Ferruginibacter sp.]